jgi:hypothetical protein
MNVLTLKSLESLKDYVNNSESVERILNDFESLEEELGLEYIPIPFSFKEDNINLIHPTPSLAAKDADRQNIITIYKAMSGLTRAQATDERLWTTLALKDFKDYALARWPLSNNKDEWPSKIRNHWLCEADVRSRVRNNAISRLWWMGHLAFRLDDMQPEIVAEVLLKNSDFSVQVLGRNTAVSSKNASTAILKVTKDALDKGLAFHRVSFREFMKRINFHAGRSNFAAMTMEQLTSLFSKIYSESYEANATK